MRVTPYQCAVLVTTKGTKQRVQRWLEPLASDVVWSTTSQELLARLELNRCQMVVIEALDATALTLSQTLKTQASTALLPQVLIVANPALRISAYEAGVDAVFLRSTHQAVVQAHLRALLQQGAMRQQWADAQLQARSHDQLLRTTFRRYVSSQLADQILALPMHNSEQLRIGARVQAAVMFADMRGFTGIAERLSADQVFALLNEFFTLLTGIAFRHGGTVFNMAGDSLMVGFGVPIPQVDGGARAVCAAREMLASFALLADQWRAHYGIETGLGIGINEGEVVAGNIGSEQYMNYTLIGDTVNVAARLTQRARAGEVLFSNSLKLSLDANGTADVPVLALPPLTLRGRASPVDIYCVPIEKRLELHH